MASQVMTGTEVPKVALYSFYRSSSAWRVRLALLFKGIPYEYKAINLQKREQYSDEFKKLSPLQLIPVLEIDGETLVDSIAIIQYLEEKFPEKRLLLPKDLLQRAHIYQVVFLISANIQPLQSSRVLVGALEQILEKTAGKYCFGDNVTLADIVLIPQVATSSSFHVDMAPYPTIQRVMKALYELPEVKASLPANQPDAPKS